MSQVVNTNGADSVCTPKSAIRMRIVASRAARIASLSLPPQNTNSDTAVRTPLQP
jgi:hypothetical protein